jgi:hypothetical protein
MDHTELKGFGQLIIENDGHKTISEFPFGHVKRIVIIINNQFTDVPNTTQIASGAGRASSAGSNAAVASSNTQQQQTVGADTGLEGAQVEPHILPGGECGCEEELIIVINNQINTAPTGAATQIASGGGVYSAAGTNAVAESSNTKQQHAVGGDADASNDGTGDDQTEV